MVNLIFFKSSKILCTWLCENFSFALYTLNDDSIQFSWGFYIYIEDLRKLLKLSKKQKYWGLKETGTSVKQNCVLTDKDMEQSKEIKQN